jgi:hypothetical protein
MGLIQSYFQMMSWEDKAHQEIMSEVYILIIHKITQKIMSNQTTLCKKIKRITIAMLKVSNVQTKLKTSKVLSSMMMKWNMNSKIVQ